jgi:ribokinase
MLCSPTMSARIAVVGSLMMDLVVRVPRLPVAGESLIGQSFELFVGGKGGNQALAAKRAGANHVAMVGRVGADEFGRRIVATLSADGVDCSHVARDGSAGTGVAIPLVLDDGSNSIVAIPQANLAMSAADIVAARDVIAGADMLLVQFEVGMEAVEAAIRLAREAGVRVLLNPAPIAPHPSELLRLPTVLVANEVEAAALVPECGGDHGREAMELLGNGPAAVVVTLGAGGALLARQEGHVFVPPFVVDGVDSVGAGDAFCGALAVALCEGVELEDAVRFASAAGAIAATRAGAAASLPSRGEIEALLRG